MWIAFKNDFASNLFFFFTIYFHLSISWRTMQLIRRVFPLFKNSILKNHHFQSFLNSSETRLQHFFAFHVCFYCLYGNNKQKNQTFNLLYIAALSRLWLHFKKSSNSDLGKVLWKVLLIHKICTSSYIFNVWYIFFFQY